MNKRAVGIIILVAVVIVTGLVYQFICRANQAPIYIAVMVPGEQSSLKSTQRAVTSIKMYADEVNARGGINGHTLQVIVKEDGNTTEGALKSLDELAQENKAMVILGNTYSNPAIAIGPKLVEYGVPAITAGATAPKVTAGNPWFFRVVPNNTTQGESIAGYATKVLGYKSAIVVHENNEYGISLSEGFQDAFRSLGGEILQIQSIDSESPTLQQEAADFMAGIEEIPDMIFLATYKESGVTTVIALKDNNITVPIIGGDDIGDLAFTEVFSNGINDNGEYTTGIYAASPLIFDVASEDAQLFRERYIKRIHENPTWFSATSYDSALIAVQAMLDANISGDPAQIGADRQKVRDQLEKYNSTGSSVQGITGTLYFDQNHNVVQPVAMGVFADHQFISAPVQLQPILDQSYIDDFNAARARQDIIYLNNHPFYKTKIVYAGADINEFSQIDVDDGHVFDVDLYLWFRYQGDVDIENIAFDNAVEPVELLPVKSAQYGDTTYNLYRIKAEFSGSYNLRNYPFDHHKLSISFRHPDYDRNELIFVADILGMGDINNTETILSSLERSRAFNAITDWQPVTGNFFQDIIHEYTNRGDPNLFGQKLDIQYSRFNINIEVRRDVLRFMAKTMLPVLFLITLAYLGFYLPGKQFETITGIMTGTILSVVFFHVDLSGRLRVGYTVAQDYVFYLIYGMLTVELLLSILAWHKENDEHYVSKMFWIMRIIYPLALLIGTFIILWAFNINPQDLFRR
jgi:ABC-type branched-subunit amino acid transport system substrate-binding protein